MPAAWAFVLLAVIFIAIDHSPASAEDFTITSFRVYIEVRQDSSLRVSETIDVFFHRPRHGLYRDIPFRYTDELGKETYTPLRIVSVTDGSGAALNHKTERAGGFIKVRIGDADRFIERRQVYVITYTVENGILHFPDHDELYWNVTGNDWTVPIEHASATAIVASAGRPLSFRTAAYTGRRGSREAAYELDPHPHGASFSATRKLAPGEGLTIVLGWEKGVVAQDPMWKWKEPIFRFDLQRNWVFAAPLLCFCIMFIRWYRAGRDPSAGGPLVVAYAPPDDDGRPLAPAEMGVLLDERLDPRDITASLVNLAVKRQVAIRETVIPGFLFDKKDYVLTKLNETGTETSSFERLLMDRLFADGKSEVRVSDLKDKFFRNIDDLKKEAFSGLTQRNCFGGNPVNIITRYQFAGFILFFGGGGVSLLADKLGWSGGDSAVIAALLSGIVVFFFAPHMPVKTSKGSKMLAATRGFEEFLGRAEKDRLERMKDANLFEKYLPYAIALGVSERWAKAFEGIYQEPPRWYESTSGGAGFHPLAFQQSLDSALTTISTSMGASPRSSGSGFSGGGGSGGGGGGGGGGSW